MNHRSDTAIGAVQAELMAVGLEHDLLPGKRHQKIRFFIRGKKFTYTVPRTTSDGFRAVKNCRAGVRRILRDNDLIQ